MIFQVLLSAAGIAYGQNSNPSPGLAIALENSKSFCLIASPFGSQNIAGMEKAAKSTCFGNPSGAMPGMKMKDGLIQSAHVVKTPHYIQVTGQLNGVAGGYNPADEGTQFDDSLASQKGVLPESGCVGYPMYLEYFSGSQYCLRCCHHAFSSYCDPTHDTQVTFIYSNYLTRRLIRAVLVVFQVISVLDLLTLLALLFPPSLSLFPIIMVYCVE